MSFVNLFKSFLIDNMETYYNNTALRVNWYQMGGFGGTDTPTRDTTTPYRGFAACKLDSDRVSGTAPYLVTTFDSQNMSAYTHVFLSAKATNLDGANVRIHDIYGDVDTYSISYNAYWTPTVIPIVWDAVDNTAITSMSFQQATNSVYYIDDLMLFKSSSENSDWLQVPSKNMKIGESVNAGGLAIAGRAGKALNLSSTPDGSYTLDVFLPRKHYETRSEAYRTFKNSGEQLLMLDDDIARPVFITGLDYNFEGGKERAIIGLKMGLTEDNNAGLN